MSDKSGMEVVKETRNEIIASMLLSGVSVPEIAEKLNLHVNSIYQATNTDAFKELMRQRASEAHEDARNLWRGAMRERIPKILKVLDKHIKEGNLKTVELVIRTLGIEKMIENQNSSGGPIQIFLPTGVQNEKEVTSIPVGESEPPIK